jgi:hypothetical protein
LWCESLSMLLHLLQLLHLIQECRNDSLLTCWKNFSLNRLPSFVVEFVKRWPVPLGQVLDGVPALIAYLTRRICMQNTCSSNGLFMEMHHESLRLILMLSRIPTYRSNGRFRRRLCARSHFPQLNLAQVQYADTADGSRRCMFVDRRISIRLHSTSNTRHIPGIRRKPRESAAKAIAVSQSCCYCPSD